MIIFEKQIAKYLAEQGIGIVGSTTDWGIFYSYMPEAPLNCVAVYDFGGRPIHDLVGYSGCNFRIQIRVRGTNYQTLTDKSIAIYNLLKFNPEITFTGGKLQNLISDTNIMNLGKVKVNSAETSLIAMNFSGLYVE